MSVLFVILLSGCLANVKNENNIERAYYLRIGEPAPIEGWLIDKADMSDLLLYSFKHARGEK